LLRLADEAVYAARALGRNRTECAPAVAPARGEGRPSIEYALTGKSFADWRARARVVRRLSLQPRAGRLGRRYRSLQALRSRMDRVLGEDGPDPSRYLGRADGRGGTIAQSQALVVASGSGRGCPGRPDHQINSWRTEYLDRPKTHIPGSPCASHECRCRSELCSDQTTDMHGAVAGLALVLPLAFIRARGSGHLAATEPGLSTR
jgi:hypothetical protein